MEPKEQATHNPSHPPGRPTPLTPYPCVRNHSLPLEQGRLATRPWGPLPIPETAANSLRTHSLSRINRFKRTPINLVTLSKSITCHGIVRSPIPPLAHFVPHATSV
jgi:hypothetical protein